MNSDPRKPRHWALPDDEAEPPTLTDCYECCGKGKIRCNACGIQVCLGCSGAGKVSKIVRATQRSYYGDPESQHPADVPTMRGPLR